MKRRRILTWISGISVFLLLSGLFTSLPTVQAALNRDTRTWTDPGGSGLQITFSTPETYGACASPGDNIYTTGVPNDWSLQGDVEVRVTQANGTPLVVANYPINQTGDLNLDITYPPAWTWPLIPVANVRDLHVSLAILVRDQDGQIVTWVGGDPVHAPGTLGPGGQDWDVFCGNTNPAPKISIVKYTNGIDANDSNGIDVPKLSAGDLITWTYRVSNPGNWPINRSYISVTDNQFGVLPVFDHEVIGNGDDVLDPAEILEYKATGAAVNLLLPPPGVVVTPNGCSLGGTLPPHNSYVNIGTVSIPEVSASDPSSYCNTPDVSIVKRTNDQLATDPNGIDVPQIKPGDPVTWTYTVTNTGPVPIKKVDVVVTDNQTGVTPAFDTEITGNADEIFDPAEVWQYKATGIAEYLLLPAPGVVVSPNGCTRGGALPPHNAYTNIGTVTVPGATAQAPSSYCNTPDVKIVKRTNGQLAVDPNGQDVPQIIPGDLVTWTYEVTNIGGVPIKKADVLVTDNQTGVSPVFDSESSGNGDAIFDPSEVWLYKATGTAVNLSAPPAGVIFTSNGCTYGGKFVPPHNAYVNIGTVTVPGASAQAPSSYCNVNVYKLYFPTGNNSLGDVTETKWQLALGYEDLPLTLSNDFDYNDWTVDVNGTNSYDVSSNMTRMRMDFLPHARGAVYNHRFQILIPPGVFKSDGTALLNIYDKNHVLISSTATAFTGAVGGTYVIFEKTSDALPGSFVNTNETVPFVAPQRFADLTFTFNSPFPFTVTENDLVQAHGKGLFFDPYIDVLNTGGQIHKGDVRMLTVPSTDYLWPEERVRIDKAYPDIIYLPGPTPDFTFPNFWWTNHNNCIYDGVACPLLP